MLVGLSKLHLQGVAFLEREKSRSTTVAAVSKLSARTVISEKEKSYKKQEERRTRVPVYVPNMVGTNVKAETMSLMDKRAAMEIEMNAIIERLSQPGGPGITGNLLDSEVLLLLFYI